MKDLLRVLLTPSCWIQNYSYSPAWDAELNRLMAQHKFVNISDCRASLGGRVVWIANHPYSSFLPQGVQEVRPSRATILRAGDKLQADTFSGGAQ